MKTNFKFIGIITLILFIVPTGLSFTFAQNGGYYEDDYGNYQPGTRVEINNYYGGYGNQISYAARINRFHRTYVSIDYFTPYYYVEYYNYYTPLWDEWSFYSPVDYYFGVNVFYSPWRYYHRPRYYSVYWSQPVYYNTYYYNYNSCRNIPVYYQSAYYGYPSKRYRGYYSHKLNNHNNYGRANHNYISSTSRGTKQMHSSGSIANHSRNRTQSNNAGISSKRRNQNHFVSNNASKENQNKYRSTFKNSGIKTKFSSGRRSAGNKYAVINRNNTSRYNQPVTHVNSDRRNVEGRFVKAKKVTTRRSNTVSKTGTRHFMAQKTAGYSSRRPMSQNRTPVKAVPNSRSKRSSYAENVRQKKTGKDEVVSERRRKR